MIRSQQREIYQIKNDANLPAPSPFFSACCAPDTRAVRRRCDVDKVAPFGCVVIGPPVADVAIVVVGAADVTEIVVFVSLASVESAESALPMGEVGVVGVKRPLISRGFSKVVADVIVVAPDGPDGVKTEGEIGARCMPIIDAVVIMRG